MASLTDLKRIAEVEFADIVNSCLRLDFKMRIFLQDGSFIDAFLSRKLSDRFGFHWERMDARRTIYRYDNVPDKLWQGLTTYPYHFHKGAQDSAEDSPFPQTPIEGFRAFMEFVRDPLK